MIVVEAVVHDADDHSRSGVVVPGASDVDVLSHCSISLTGVLEVPLRSELSVVGSESWILLLLEER